MPPAVAAWSLAGQPDRARAELSEYEKLIASGAYVPPAGEAESARALVLAAESRHNEALQAVGTSNNQFALIAGYQALTGLGRNQEARERLQRLLALKNYAVDNATLPLLRLMYGGA